MSGKNYAQHNSFSLSIISSDDFLSDELVDEWNNLLDKSRNINSLYQSPEWYEHLMIAKPNADKLLCVIRNKTKALIGLVPIFVDEYKLKFNVYEYSLWEKRIQGIFILGSEPLLSGESSLCYDVFQLLWEKFPKCDCIYIDSLSTDSYVWDYIIKSQNIKNNYLLYIPDGVRNFHSLELSRTFDNYLKKFKSKTRNTLKRKIKKLNKYSKGNLKLERIESKDQVDSFLEQAVLVAKNSWQENKIGTRIDRSDKRKTKLIDLTERGILRSYILKCHKKPCAFVLGYQYKSVFHYVEIAYNHEYQKFSPGTVLLYLLIEDLHTYNSPDILNFGIGDAAYKNEFGNTHGADASVLILRNTLSNRLLRLFHSSFRSLIQQIKKMLNK